MRALFALHGKWLEVHEKKKHWGSTHPLIFHLLPGSGNKTKQKNIKEFFLPATSSSSSLGMRHAHDGYVIPSVYNMAKKLPWPGAIMIRCQNHLNWLLLMQHIIGQLKIIVSYMVAKINHEKRKSATCSYNFSITRYKQKNRSTSTIRTNKYNHK